MKLQTKDIYRFSPSSKIALTLTSVFAFAGFTWPFFAADKSSAHIAQYFFWIALPLALCTSPMTSERAAIEPATITAYKKN